MSDTAAIWFHERHIPPAGVVYYIYSNFNGWMFGILTVVCIFVTLLIIGMVVPDEDKKEKKVK